MSSQSWGSLIVLNADVADGASLTEPIQDNLTAIDPTTAQVSVDNVIVPATVTFAADLSSVTIQNNSGATWSAGSTVYAYVAAKAVPDRVATNEAKLADHEARITKLEARPGPPSTVQVTRVD